MNKRNHNSGGFTIVELLIVIVVIAILATIAIISYNGVQNQARAVSVTADTTNISKQLDLSKINNPQGLYPNALGDINAKASQGNVAQYTTYNSGAGYCLQVQNSQGNISKYNVAGGAVKDGQCTTVKNIITTPRGALFSPNTGFTSRTTGVSWGGKDNWNQHTYAGSGDTTNRMFFNLSDLTNGRTYTLSFLLGNPTSNPVTVSFDFCDQTTQTYTIAPGEQRRISFGGMRSAYDSTYRFADMGVANGVASTLLVADGLMTEGTKVYDYADGDSLNWSWTGTPNNSTSTGPGL